MVPLLATSGLQLALVKRGRQFSLDRGLARNCLAISPSPDGGNRRHSADPISGTLESVRREVWSAGDEEIVALNPPTHPERRTMRVVPA